MVIDYFMDDRYLSLPIAGMHFYFEFSQKGVREIANDGSVFFNTAPVPSQN
jgi:hypothetical protein